MTTVRFGTAYGGFEYHKDILTTLNSSSVVYCFGAGEDISHDVQLSHTFGCDVHIFDPTPRAIQHVKDVQAAYEGIIPLKASKQYGGGDPTYTNILMKYRVDPTHIKLYPYGISNSTGTAKFYMPENPEYVSCSAIQKLKGDEFITVEMKCLKDIMTSLQHTKIDLLKMDIEGLECDVLEDMMNINIFPTFLAVEFDLATSGEKKDMERSRDIVQKLLAKGYNIVNQESYNMTFMYQKNRA